MPLTCTKTSRINPANHLTGYDGSQKWNLVHEKFNSIPCEYCRQKAIKLGRGLHDSVNVHLGKKKKYPKDLDFLHNYVTRAVQNE